MFKHNSIISIRVNLNKESVYLSIHETMYIVIQEKHLNY